MGSATSRVAAAAMKNNTTSSNHNNNNASSGHHHHPHHHHPLGATAISSEITVSDSDVSSSASCSGPNSNNHHNNNNTQQPQEQEQPFSLQDEFATNNCNNTNKKSNLTTTWPCANCHSMVSSQDMRCPVCHGRQVKLEAEGGAGTMLLRSTSAWLERVSSPTTTTDGKGGRNETPLSETTTTTSVTAHYDASAEEMTAALPPPPVHVLTKNGTEATAIPPPPPPSNSSPTTVETDPEDALDLGGDGDEDIALEAVSSLPRHASSLEPKTTATTCTTTTTATTTTSIVVEGDEMRPVDPVAVTLASVPSPIPHHHHHHHHPITTTASTIKPFSSSSPPILLATIPGTEGKEDGRLGYANDDDDDDMYGSHEDLVILEVQTEPSFDGKRKISSNGMMDDSLQGALASTAAADAQLDQWKTNQTDPADEQYNVDQKDDGDLDPFTNLAEAKKRKAAK